MLNRLVIKISKNVYYYIINELTGKQLQKCYIFFTEIFHSFNKDDIKEIQKIKNSPKKLY